MGEALHCCQPGCEQPAKFWVGESEPDKYTHACADHVDELRGEYDSVYHLNADGTASGLVRGPDKIRKKAKAL